MKFHRTSTLMLAALALSNTAFAQTAPAEPQDSLSFNLGVVSDYRYRGITQSARKPALQGGVDFAHKSGFYVGAWGSTIHWIKDSGASEGPVELDLYGGYKGEIGAGLGYDVGYLRYEYVGNKYAEVSGVNANTDEVYGALTYGPATLKYSHSVSNLFGTPDSKGSGYLDASASFDLGEGWTLVPHVGRQVVHHNGLANYTDYALTVTKDLGNGLSASIGAVGTNAKEAFYTNTKTAFTGKGGVVLGLKYSF